MRTPHERDIVFLDFEICSEPSYAGKYHLSYFISKVQELVNDGVSDYWNKKRTNKTYIRKIDVDNHNNCVKFLLCYTDSTVPGIPVADIDTNTQRNEKLTQREGSPHTAHLIIKLTPIVSNPNIYEGFLEEGERLKRNDVEKYFNFLFRTIKTKYPDDFLMNAIDGSVDESGKVKKDRYSNSFNIQGKLSKDFQRILQEGRILGLTLVSDQVSSLGIGNGYSIQPRRKEISLVSNSGPLSLLTNAIQTACHIGKDVNYESLRINFSNGKKLSSSVTINTQNQNVVGDGFLRKERLGFSIPLIEAEEDFNNTILEKMLELL